MFSSVSQIVIQDLVPQIPRDFRNSHNVTCDEYIFPRKLKYFWNLKSARLMILMFFFPFEFEE